MKSKTGYRFIKYHDPASQYDLTDVCIRIDSGATRDQLLEAFADFLRACSFAVDGEIEVIKNEVEE